jgi:AbrB family looped-hinge helix DNA binding protein
MREFLAMPRTRLSTKGQLIVPQELRERLGWEPGTLLEIEIEGDAVVVKRALDVPRTTIKDVLGCANYRGPRRSIEEMEAAIAEAARRNR